MPKRAETTWPAVRGQLSAQSTPIRSAPPFAGPAPERGYGQNPAPRQPAKTGPGFTIKRDPCPALGAPLTAWPAAPRPAPPPRKLGALTRHPRPLNASHPGRHRMSRRSQAIESLQVKALAIVKAAARSGSGDELSFGKGPRHRATPGGYGGKPPGVAFIGVPTGARNAGHGAPTGDQSTDMNATRKPPRMCQDPITSPSQVGAWNRSPSRYGGRESGMPRRVPGPLLSTS